jgi:hypothetical protein
MSVGLTSECFDGLHSACGSNGGAGCDCDCHYEDEGENLNEEGNYCDCSSEERQS